MGVRPRCFGASLIITLPFFSRCVFFALIVTTLAVVAAACCASLEVQPPSHEIAPQVSQNISHSICSYH
jgi:hypothetical protein